MLIEGDDNARILPLVASELPSAQEPKICASSPVKQTVRKHPANMLLTSVCLLILSFLLQSVVGVTLIRIPERKKVHCGDFGFKCYGSSKLRLCADDKTYGPSFLCPPDTFCNEASSEVCQTAFSYIDPEKTNITLTRCRRYERIADASVPNCKGYILCIPNKNQFQGVKFKCTGNTVFNGITRSCSSSSKYKCPVVSNVTTTTPLKFADEDDAPFDRPDGGGFTTQSYSSSRDSASEHKHYARPIDCKNYKFTVQSENSSSGRVTYFCPPRAVPGEGFPRCTVFSNHFCITLHREEEDQFSPGTRRRPRFRNVF